MRILAPKFELILKIQFSFIMRCDTVFWLEVAQSWDQILSVMSQLEIILELNPSY
jgi:hypothetical protein